MIASLMYKGAKARAKKDDLPFTITKEDILKLIGDGVCPVLKVPYDLTSNKITDRTFNLDRFIPSLGYTKENCVVMSSLANRIKSNATTEQVCRVAAWMKQQNKKNKA